jgi:hypothetical protein
VSSEVNAHTDDSGSVFVPRPWSWHDAVAILIWTVAIAGFFWNAVSLRGALFYFDITEINYPYRAFFAAELKAGRFSRWCPGLYCGLPLYSESQAGYLHPLKYLFYPWMETWKAFNLDTVCSIWLTGLGSYLWLRRHVGPTAALSGAAVFGLSGFTWAHFVHTSMINALASVPFVIWGLEYSWSSGRWRGVVLGACALAFQTFAGHLQDVILTVGLVGLYGLYRAATERGAAGRLRAIGMALALGGLGILLSAVQWVPSKELLDRSPRAAGLSWADLTYASWHPELLPTLVIREAYGTRARHTDWMNGFYPYHEMDTYLGLIAIVLAVVGAGGRPGRDRWVTFWVLLVGLSALFMLGRFTFLFDYANKIPIARSSREPVRFHLWAAFAVSALVAVGVERLGRSEGVSLRAGLIVAGWLVLLSIPIFLTVYAPVWLGASRSNSARNVLQFRWLGHELLIALGRTVFLSAGAWWVARTATRTADPPRRARWVALLPLLIIADLVGSHWRDVPTIDPRYWTEPPETALRLKADPGLVRIIGQADKAANEPGYASETINFFGVRDQLDWSLAPVWNILGSRGETPIIGRRYLDFTDNAAPEAGRFDIMSVTHVLPARPRGLIQRNQSAFPRVRLAGRPIYAKDQGEAAGWIVELSSSDQLRDHVIVEDPTCPLAADAEVTGSARIAREIPERLVVETEAAAPSYLVVSDSFDPGWTATVDGRPATIHPAYCAFRAVFLPAGKHEVIFEYSPAGFRLGLGISLFGIVVGFLLWFMPRSRAPLASEHALLDVPPKFKTWYFAVLVAIVLVSVPGISPQGGLTIQSRWHKSLHTFTWKSGYEAMQPRPSRAPVARPPKAQARSAKPAK